MRKSLFVKRMLLGVALTIIFSAFSYASGEEEIKLQGYLMGMNFSQNKIFVNERTYFFDGKTAVMNDQGLPVSFDKLKPDSWVYMKLKKDEVRKRMVIREIYLLPRYINYKEQNRYPFMD